MNRLFLMAGIVGILLLGCSSSSLTPNGNLGTFKGSVKDLLPQEAGAFKLGRAESMPKEDAAVITMGAVNGALAEYGAEGKVFSFLGYNFESPEKAKAAFDTWKQKINKMGMKTQEEGPKKKGDIIVGDRTVAKGENMYTAAKVILWTNGSVLFTVSSQKASDDPFEFEKQFPY